MNKVCIIGIGPGSEEYLLPIARKEIEKADCLIGAKRLLSLFVELNKEKILIEGHFSQVIPYLKKNRHKKKIAVLVSGDPGLYSFLGVINRVLKKEEYVVIPGVSSLQIAFAKMGESWQEANIISLHGRRINRLAEKVKNYQEIFLFTDDKFPPEKIASYLLKKGIKRRRAIVFENLAYPNERIVDTDLESLAKMKGFGLCVMTIKK